MNKRAKILDSIAVVANFSGKSTFNNLSIVSLIERDINVWKPENCSLCAKGSHALPAREDWLTLLNNNGKNI